MSAKQSLTATQKLNQKLVYTLTWGGVAANTGALVVSGFKISIVSWALSCAIMAAGSLASTVLMQRNWRFAVHSLAGPLLGIVLGGIVGALVRLSTAYYPVAMTGLLGALALFFTTWVGEKRAFNATRLARGCMNWAMVIAVVYTLATILGGGFATAPDYQPVLGAVMAFWATLLGIAALEGDS